MKRDQKRIDNLFNRNKEKGSELLSDLETVHSDWMSSDDELEYFIYSANNSITISFEENPELESISQNDVILYEPRNR